MFLKLNNLKLKTILGIYDWEQNLPREIIINATITTSHNNVLKTNNINDSIDYEKVTNKIKAIVKTNHELAEILANKIIEAILEFDNVKEVTLELAKVGAVKDLESFSIILNKTK